MMSRSTGLIAFLLPIRLSSTTKTILNPACRKASSSAKTCSLALRRGRRPKVTMMSQNSQVNGQPREICKLPNMYRLIFNKSMRGSGNLVTSVFCCCS